MLGDIIWTLFHTPFLAFFPLPFCQNLSTVGGSPPDPRQAPGEEHIAYVIMCAVNSGSLGTWRSLKSLVNISKYHLPSFKMVGKASLSQ